MVQKRVALQTVQNAPGHWNAESFAIRPVSISFSLCNHDGIIQLFKRALSEQAVQR